MKKDLNLDDLLDIASKTKGITEGTKSSEVINKEDESPLNIPIESDDNFLKVALKEAINNSGKTLEDLYRAKGRQKGYNMYYSLFKKGELGFKRVIEWADFLEKDLLIQFIDRK